MSPRTKFWLIALVMIVGALTISPKMIGLSDDYEELLFFSWLGVGSILMVLVKCPQCGTPLAFQGTIKGIPMVAGFANRHCAKCGHDLTSSE